MKRWSMLLLLLMVAMESIAVAQTPAIARSVLPAKRRLDSLKIAAEVLASREPMWREEVPTLSNPFYAARPVKNPEQASPAEAARPTMSDEEVLQAADAQIKPDGTFVTESGAFLLLNGKRLKVGDFVTITLGGVDYAIEISVIERNSYTLRINHQELRRIFR